MRGALEPARSDRKMVNHPAGAPDITPTPRES